MVWFLDVLVVELEHEGIKFALAMGFQEFGRKQEINKLGRYRTVVGGVEETAILVRRRVGGFPLSTGSG